MKKKQNRQCMITQLAQRCETNRTLNMHKARENLFEKTNPKKNIHTYKVEQKRTYNRRLWLRVIFVCLFVLVFDWLYFCCCCYSFSTSSFSCEVFFVWNVNLNVYTIYRYNIYTAISIYVVGSKLQGYGTWPKGSMGRLHFFHPNGSPSEIFAVWTRHC